MITLKSPHEIELMRRAGKITAAARAYAGELVKPGVTTHEIDRAVEHFIRKQGAVPSFLHYNGYPASACISVNDEIIHGIPGPRVLQEGDIVSVDVGAYIGGFHGDCAATFPCGRISPEAQDLIDVTRQSFFEGIKFAKEGYRLFDISAAISTWRVTATPSSGNTSATVSAPRCTSRRRSPITAIPAGGPGSSAA